MPELHQPTRLSRRDLLGLAARGAASVVVSQVLLGCATEGATAAAADTALSGGSPSTTTDCVLTAALTEGPFFVDEKLNRSDIRSDPADGTRRPGAPLRIAFNVMRVDGDACTPLTGAYLDVWHCDAAGTYSDVSGMGNGSAGAGRKFLRGYQITDASGVARFTTIYPGWYQGRAVHIHFKIRTDPEASAGFEFTSQLFFDDELSRTVYSTGVYAQKGPQDMPNASDGIFNQSGGATLLSVSQDGDGYKATFPIAVQLT